MAELPTATSSAELLVSVAKSVETCVLPPPSKCLLLTASFARFSKSSGVAKTTNRIVTQGWCEGGRPSKVEGCPSHSARSLERVVAMHMGLL